MLTVAYLAHLCGSCAPETLESTEALGVRGDQLRENADGDVSLKRRAARMPDRSEFHVDVLTADLDRASPRYIILQPCLT